MNLEKRLVIGVATTDIKPILEYKRYINSFFVGIPIIGNCRGNYILIDFFEKFISDCEDIPVWVTANLPVVPPHQIELVLDTLIGYHRKFKFHGYIASNIILLRYLKEAGIPVKVSTVADIRDLNDVNRYYSAGFNNIVLSYKMNRNLDFVNEAVKKFTNIQFTLITNELCESDCPYRAAHFITTSQNLQPGYVCPIRTPKNTYEWRLKVLQNTFIPPENLKYYPENILFKLPTRMRGYSSNQIIEAIKLYTSEKEYENLLQFFDHHLDISKLTPLKVNKDTYKKWLNCKNQCYECNICSNELERENRVKNDN